jgi:ATP-dependent DNA ligase
MLGPMSQVFRAVFIQPMLLQRTERLPEGEAWLYEVKLDGYRAVAIKIGGKVRLRSRNGTRLTIRPGLYPRLASPGWLTILPHPLQQKDPP